MHVGRTRRRVALRAPRRSCRARALHRLCALRPGACCRRGVCRHQGGRARHRHRGLAQGCKPRFVGPRLAHRSCGLHRHLLLRRALPSGDCRRRSVGYSWSRTPRRHHRQNEPVPLSEGAHGRPVARDLDRAVSALAPLFGRDHVITDIAIFFSKLAVVTFGGAYSVLAYMAQQAVEDLWLGQRRRDARWPGSRRNDARAADPRHRIRRLPRRLPPWRRTQARLRLARRRDHALGDLRALLPVDLRRRALRRALSARTPTLQAR